MAENWSKIIPGINAKPGIGADKIITEFSLSAVGERLDLLLTERLTSLSRERVKALIKSGKVVGKLVGKVSDNDGLLLTSPSMRLARPMTVAVEMPPLESCASSALDPQDLDLTVAYEDEHLIVIDKPIGMVVHPVANYSHDTLVNALLHHCRGRLSELGGHMRPGIVHRIDKDTSGLLVAAKHDKAHEGLARQFAAHSIERRYLAIVAGHPVLAEQTVTATIGRSRTNRKKMAVVEEGYGKHAVTHFATKEALSGAAVIECRLETGRTHQVRVHMTHIGHPLLGDQTYGRVRGSLSVLLAAQGFARQALHAAGLAFIHPVSGKRIALYSELPTDMRELIAALRV